MLLQVVQVVHLLVVLLLFGFGDAVMYDGALISSNHIMMIFDIYFTNSGIVSR